MGSGLWESLGSFCFQFDLCAVHLRLVSQFLVLAICCRASHQGIPLDPQAKINSVLFKLLLIVVFICNHKKHIIH